MAALPAMAAGRSPLPQEKFVVAHRGASAYAPENTLESYRLAIQQGADYVEQDLQVTRDGVLVCCHDSSLERTTNVSEVFPDRFRETAISGKTVKHWPVHDFTIKEIKQLDAGSHFDSKFRGATMPTWQEAIEEIKGKAGLCPESKDPELHARLGFDMEALMVDTIKRNGLDQPDANSTTPILVQSFSKASLKKFRDQHRTKWPLLWLKNGKTTWTSAVMEEAAGFVDAIGAYKEDITAELVKRVHTSGLGVVAYTFGSNLPGCTMNTVSGEMAHPLFDLGVDGLFSNNPDKFPRQKAPMK